MKKIRLSIRAAIQELSANSNDVQQDLGQIVRKQHVLVSESYIPLVRAAVEVQRSPGDHRREPKEAIQSRAELPRGVFSPEAAQASREEDGLEETGMLRHQELASTSERLTHSTGSHPKGATWSFGPVRKSFRLSKCPNMRSS